MAPPFFLFSPSSSYFSVEVTPSRSLLHAPDYPLVMYFDFLSFVLPFFASSMPEAEFASLSFTLNSDTGVAIDWKLAPAKREETA